MAIQDIHTHILPQQPGTALVSIDCNPTQLLPGHFYSVGIHPWDSTCSSVRGLDILSSMLSDPSVLAVGECGLDRLKGPSLDIQTGLLLRQLELSEQFGKPVILHIVKCFDEIISLKKQFRPSSRWLIHGFRGGSVQARQLLSQGFELSLGLCSNAETAAFISSSRLFLETDGKCPISNVIQHVAAARNATPNDIGTLAAENASDFLYRTCIDR